MVGESSVRGDRYRLPADAERRSRRLAEDRFREFLRERDLLLTASREAILQEFYRIHEHIEADELLFRLKRGGHDVSRATVYRTLDLLVQAGLARRVSLGKDHAYYEHILGREAHEHMICLGCDRVIEWVDLELRDLLARNCRERSFRPARHSLQIFGYCEDCAAREEVQQQLEVAEDANLLDEP